MGFKKLSREQIKGIVNLVSNSVEGLKPENVKIIDSFGIVLSDALNKNKENITEGVEKKISYKKNLERYYEKRIQNMLEKVVGKGRVIATVTADLDFTKKEQTMEVYDPENVAERSHQKVEENSIDYNKKQGGAPGVISNVPSVMAQQNQNLKNKNIKKSYNKNQEVVNYEVSKTVSKVVNPVGSIVRLSAAVIIDGNYKTVKKGKKEVKEFVPRSKEEMATFKEIVKKAIGFNVKRNDQIEVSCVAFSYSEAEEIQKTIAKERRNELIITGVKYALTIIALLIIFLFILKPFLKTVMTKVKPPEELTSGFPESVAVAEGGEVSETYGEPGAVGGTGIESAPPEKTPEDIVKEIIESNPDKVAQVVKQWLRSK
jgi:flagellar M-ring protein FliF